jgi:carbon storage regulator
MLVLSRKVGERIQLGDKITVTLVKISGNMVRLGIEAPPQMVVVREELLHCAGQQPIVESFEEESAAS